MSQTRQPTTDDTNSQLDHLEAHSPFARADLEAMSDAERMTVLRGTGRPDADLRERLVEDWTTVCAVVWRNTDWSTAKTGQTNRADKFAEVLDTAKNRTTVAKAVEKMCTDLGQPSLPEAGEAFARLRAEDNLAMDVLEAERITIVSETNMTVSRYFEALADDDTDKEPDHDPATTDLSQFVGDAQ